MFSVEKFSTSHWNKKKCSLEHERYKVAIFGNSVTKPLTVSLKRYYLVENNHNLIYKFLTLMQQRVSRRKPMGLE